MPSSKKAAKRQPKPKPVSWAKPPPEPKPPAGSDDDDDEEEEVDDVPCTNCYVCVTKKTTRRCSVCGVCVLCSTDCEQTYMNGHDGLAACNLHLPSKLSVKDPFAIDAHNFGGVDRACMWTVRQLYEPGEAVASALEWLIGMISLDPEVPLHENSVVGLSLAPLPNEKYSTGVKRTLDINFSADQPNNEMLIVMLNRLVRLALSQQLLHKPNAVDGANIGPLIFLLGKPVRHPRLNAHVLQLDLIHVSHTRLYSAANLLCACDADTVLYCRTFFAQRLAVTRSKSAKFMMAFDAGVLPSPVTTKGLTPLLTEPEMARALSRQTAWNSTDYSSS